MSAGTERHLAGVGCGLAREGRKGMPEGGPA